MFGRNKITPNELKSLVRTVPDFPVKGIQFRDITTLIGHGEGFAATVDWLAERVSTSRVTALAGMEARGFIFGAAVAAKLALPFLPVRKPGKLPGQILGIDYALEYGSDRLEMNPASVVEGQQVAMVDDLLATGGTACATAQLLREAGAVVEHAFFVIYLPELGGAEKLANGGVKTVSLMEFDGD